MLLHYSEEFNNDLGARADQGLSLSLSFSVCEGIESVVQSTDTNHCSGGERAAILETINNSEEPM